MTDLLRNRKFWVGAGAVLAAALAVAAYAFPPWPPGISLFFDLLAFGVMLMGGLMLISQFVLPVQTRFERRAVFDHFMNYVAGGAGPIIFVKDGQLIGRKKELQKYGHGVALVDAVSAVVIERTAAHHRWFSAPIPAGTAQPAASGPPLVRAAGPGIVFIAPGERLVATLDLRPQTRGGRAHGLTRDGIECEVYVNVTFSLDPNPDGGGSADAEAPAPDRAERNLPAFPFNASSAFRAVYGVALGEKQKVEWTDLPLTVATERFRDVLAEYKLDELFQPTKPDVYPFPDFQGRVNAAVKADAVLRERGLVVSSVSISGFNMPREVLNQRVRSWRARWQKATIQQEAAGETQAIRTESRWQTEAQQNIFKDIEALLGATEDPLARRALALTLLKALKRAVARPATRQRLPADVVRTIDSLGDV